ncbi:hypothetical protein [Phenylobacterium aquaticum]|uniref:hypothetical protein n=1 Tax=Phenylobacterium aquaticum TaxID=1763816 RepID=UPI001F5CFBA6|nr:hypothetical protein [Phenylobacterium aquaticum]MCI3130845.1 hypothetical protein [Phenylobacterium aquaticum]
MPLTPAHQADLETVEAVWRAAWDAEVAQADPWHTRQLVLVTGLLLPVWNSLRPSRPASGASSPPTASAGSAGSSTVARSPG